jgi:L-aminoadipate-semialdehyde dehydrogenase
MEERSLRIKSIFQQLGIKESNPGACSCINSWTTDPEGKDLVSYDPTSGKPLATIRQVTDKTYEKILENAQGTFKTWRNVPAPKRGLLVRDLGNALRDVREPLGELIALEMGKIKAEGIGEVQEMIDICDFAVGLSRQLYGLTMPSERPGHRMYEQWHPLGPIGIITAFNFPAAVWAWNSAIAAVCGNTMLWNPSSSVNLVAVAIQHVANKVMQKHDAGGLFNLVAGSGRTIGDTMLKDKRLPLISFTGSVFIGKHVGTTIAGRLGKSILELGGNNAVIVSAEADLDLALRAIVFGAVGTAGQRCTSTRRVIVHKSIANELTDRLVNAYAQVRIGDPTDDTTLMGPLVNRKAVDDMMAALSSARDQGGEILTGGKERTDLGDCFVEPTIVRMPSQTDLVCEETFAPILYVLEFDTLEEALELHNEVPQGLSSAMFTNNLRESEQFLSCNGSDCGIANINLGTSGAEIGGAFGGEKETGGGRESGSDAWKGYMRRQTNTVNWSDSLPLAQGINFR